jgi:hypothetical protein
MILYIAGPMTGRADFNFPAFCEAAAQLRAAGYEVVNPAESVDNTALPWEYHMRRDIRSLMDCDAVALLPGWGESRGARLEKWVATEIGMPWGTVAHWLECESS